LALQMLFLRHDLAQQRRTPFHLDQALAALALLEARRRHVQAGRLGALEQALPERGRHPLAVEREREGGGGLVLDREAHCGAATAAWSMPSSLLNSSTALAASAA